MLAPTAKTACDEKGYVQGTVILLLGPASSIADDLGLDDATIYRYAHAW